MEIYDEEIGGETAEIGIHTLAAMDCDREPEEMMAALQGKARELINAGKFLCMLGGEHSITAPVVRAFGEKFPKLSVLQIDAHAPLRNAHEGTPHSHACASPRFLDVCPTVPVAIRSPSPPPTPLLP